MRDNGLQENQKNILLDFKQFPKELKHRNPVLFYLGIFLSIIFGVFVVSILICRYSIYELCHWLKPGKFAFSFAVYTFTMGWYLYYLKDTLSKTTLKAITWIIAIVILLEMMIMLLQSWMSSASYSTVDISLPLTESIKEKFYVMSNTLILLNAGITAFITTQFFKNIQLKPTIYLWSLRASLVIFLLSCLLGFLMMVYYGQTIPNQNSLSMPFSQFSTFRNNLISIHFLGLHSIQLIPFTTYYLQNHLGKKFIFSIVTTYCIVSFILIFRLTNA